jgi:hypothetical protein
MKTSLLTVWPLSLALLAAGCGDADQPGTEAGENTGESGVVSEATHEGAGDPAHAAEPGTGSAGESSGTADQSGSIGSGVDAQGGGGSGVSGAQGGDASSGDTKANPTTQTDDAAGSDPGDN